MKLCYGGGQWWLKDSKAVPKRLERTPVLVYLPPEPQPKIPDNALAVLLLEACAYLELEIESVTGEGRKSDVSRARMIIGFIANVDFGISYERIGQILRKDQSSVSGAIRRAKSRGMTDVAFDEDLRVIRARTLAKLARMRAATMEAM